MSDVLQGVLGETGWYIEDENGNEVSYDAAARILAASPPAADPLDVERLTEALHAVGVGCSSYICEPTTSTYIGLRKTMHETDAREVAAEYARLTREGEQR